ncbi:2-amino-4-hydroxy-6-hydroxymethyldihydropteridine diphosphokinase [Georgenia faecalis]|uniref:Bifunctional folate synthesis protein n=1 Tax=Georgenia faecalis TaxID=2483799 RepID=A0ABV9DEB4_9MICO|nr:2-amino-4-hydroxy-6-hydroxymethyldihydropteridine diphosphokinase [Georgenia faecalis]
MRPPVHDDAGAVLDQVEVTGLRAFGRHGVFPEERREGQTFLADVVLHLDSREAAGSDDLAATVSYADVAEEAVAVLAGEPADLLETVAARIAERALRHRAVRAVDVSVHKPEAPLTVPFTDVTVSVRRHQDRAGVLDARPPAPVEFVVAVGANLGDAATTLRRATAELANHLGVELTALSPLARTAPVLAPGAAPQPDYLNAVLVGRTTLSPRELLGLCHAVEAAHGRQRLERWGARTLDLDVISVGGIVAADDHLELPHPRAHERAFVLRPWLAAQPDATLPGHGRVADLAADADGELEWVAGPWADVGLPADTGTGEDH